MRPVVRNVLIICVFIMLSPVTYAQQPWKKAVIEMQSRWAKDVGPNNTHEEYPRPQMMRENWTNLNGLWDYCITSGDNDRPGPFVRQILVPYPLESALSGVKKRLLPDQLLWYKKKFNSPELKDGERLLLNFGAVDWQATVFINGNRVGEHKGGYTAFSLDITRFIKGGTNEIIVKVFDPSDRGIGPHGKQVLNPANIYYTPSSGIWQTVWLEKVPSSYISGVVTIPNIDKGTLSVNVAVKGSLEKLSVRIEAKTGKKIISTINGKPEDAISLPVLDPVLWSPDTPFLYDLSIELLKGSKVIDKISSYFGMRKVDIQKDENGYARIFLNNKYTYNLGILDQGFWPTGLYTAPTDEALAFDIKAIKELGFNTIRKHIKIEPARWYYYADKLGVLVWQDFVNPNQVLPSGAKEEFEREVKETIDQLYNHPSIITWVLFNERWGAYDQGRLTQWVKLYDPSRIVNGHSGQLLYVNNKLRDTADSPYIYSDFTDVHSYPNPRNALSLPGKAKVLGEFGGIGVPVPYHQWNDLQGWGYIQVTPSELTEKYRNMMELVKQLEKEGLSGSIYTQPFDVEGEENGLLTYDREVIKIPADTIRKINSLLVPKSIINNPYKDFFLAKNIDTHDTDERYYELLNDYDNGKRDSAFLRRLVLMALRKNDSLRTVSISKMYIDSRKQMYSQENLNFFRFITRHSSDPSFTFFMNNQEKVNSILGNDAAKKVIKDIIEKEEIIPYTSNQKKIDWDAIQRKVTAKYGNLGEEFVIGRRMLYYWTVSNEWEKLGKYYVLYFQKALDRSEYHINNVSWKIFQHVKDTSVLSFATKVMKHNLEIFDKSNYAAYDTYANLLYKLGKTNEALQWEEKALKMSDNKQSIYETYNKMKKGLPTWQ